MQTSQKIGLRGQLGARLAMRKVRKTMSILQRIRRCLKPGKATVDETPPFYKLPPTCQVPKIDVIYEQYFGQRTDGCFVEVGAFDGEYSSNTSGLADIGWTGYYIEPVPEYCQRCRERHESNKNVTVSECAIGSEPGNVEVNVGGPLLERFYRALKRCENGQLSLDSKERAKLVKQYYEQKQIILASDSGREKPLKKSRLKALLRRIARL